MWAGLVAHLRQVPACRSLCLAPFCSASSLSISSNLAPVGATPAAAAMGMLLVERLRRAGMTFKVLEEGAAAASSK